MATTSNILHVVVAGEDESKPMMPQFLQLMLVLKNNQYFELTRNIRLLESHISFRYSNQLIGWTWWTPFQTRLNLLFDSKENLYIHNFPPGENCGCLEKENQPQTNTIIASLDPPGQTIHVADSSPGVTRRHLETLKALPLGVQVIFRIEASCSLSAVRVLVLW